MSKKTRLEKLPKSIVKVIRMPKEVAEKADTDRNKLGLTLSAYVRMLIMKAR